jgi:magnesium transporter
VIRTFGAQDGRLQRIGEPPEKVTALVWVDLVRPTREEEQYVESLLAVDIPTREEMQEIEISSRLYYEEDVFFMTATLPAHTDSDDLLMGPVTFMMVGDRLVTVRYHEPRAFSTYPDHAEKSNVGITGGAAVLMGLLEASVDRLADVLERLQRDIDAVSRSIFQDTVGPLLGDDGLQGVLRRVGRKGDVVSNLMDSLATLGRMAGFLSHFAVQRHVGGDLRARIKTLGRDIQSLIDHASFLAQKTTFLLEATLGLINIQQNATIKIFSVVAVVFLPPTLIASMYGMNFAHMPELRWTFGYPLALVVMLGSAVLPYWYFKKRGWL